jgi:hypothetical protein
MPNLHNFLSGVPGRAEREAAMVARRMNFRIGLAAALVAGLLTSVHSCCSPPEWMAEDGLAGAAGPVWYPLLFLAAPAWVAVRSGCTAPGANAAAAGSR